MMQAKMCSLLMLDESGEWLDLRASYGRRRSLRAKTRLNAAKPARHRRPPPQAHPG